MGKPFDLKDMLPKARVPCELFLGRMQPLHNGHAGIIRSMHNGVVAIVKGAVTGLDRIKNPLSFDYQAKLVRKIAPHVEIIAVPTGYLPEIVNMLRHEGKEVQTLWGGSDRISEYKAKVDRANKSLPADKQISIHFREADRAEDPASGTAVRQAIRSNNEAAFKQNMPREIWSEFKTLKRLLENTMLEDNKFVPTGFKTFDEFLNEDSNVAAPIENPEKPLGSKKSEDEKEE